MTDLWLPPGARRFDDDVECVISESEDPAHMREAAEFLREQGFKFPEKGRFGAEVGPESTVLLFAQRWTRIENDKGEHPLTAVVKSDELRRMVMDGTMEYENAYQADWVEQPMLNALCPAMIFRLAPFQTFTPLAHESTAAPDDWQAILRSDGFAYAMEQDDGTGFAYFSSGPLHAAPAGLVVAGRESRKVGRNERCPCGSGLKFKKCCGR